MQKATAIGIVSALTAGAALCLGAAVAKAVELPKLAPLTGCYADVSTAGTFAKAGDREATGAIGGGCTIASLGVVIVGAGARADFGDVKSGAFYGRAGIKINPHADIYGLAEWRMPDWHVRTQGQLALGGGAEISLGFKDNLSAFVEGTTTAARIMGPVTTDDVTVRVGLRYWLK